MSRFICPTTGDDVTSFSHRMVLLSVICAFFRNSSLWGKFLLLVPSLGRAWLLVSFFLKIRCSFDFKPGLVMQRKVSEFVYFLQHNMN